MKAYVQQFLTDFGRIFDKVWHWVYLQSGVIWQRFSPGVSQRRAKLQSLNDHLNQFWDNLTIKLQAGLNTLVNWHQNHIIVPPIWLQYTQEKLDYCKRKLSVAMDWAHQHSNTVSNHVHHLLEKIKEYALLKWQHYKPHIDKISRWSIAANTTASTLKVSIQVLPILFTIFTIFGTTIPLLGMIFPKFMMTEAVLLALVACISVFAGYVEFNKQIKRAELDALTEKHAEEVSLLREHIQHLEKRLTSLEGHSQEALLDSLLTPKPGPVHTPKELIRAAADASQQVPTTPHSQANEKPTISIH